MHFGLTYDLRRDYLAEGFSPEATAEFDADETVDALAAAIAACGHTVTRIGHGRALAQRLVAGARWDIVFTIAEGMYGRAREAQVPALLELYNIPYVGSDPLVCAATLDKAIAKTLVRAAGVRTPPFAVVRSTADIARVQLQFPLFVKPVAEGTGKGISRVSRVTDAAQLRQAGMVLLCFTGDQVCLDGAKRTAGAAPSRTIQTSISQKDWGKVLQARSYTMMVVPPRP